CFRVHRDVWEGCTLGQRRAPFLTAPHNGAEHFTTVPFNIIEPMTYTIGARTIHHTIKQDHKIPTTLPMRIATCTGTIQHNVCLRLDFMHCLFDAFKEFCALHHMSPMPCRVPLLRLCKNPTGCLLSQEDI